MNSPAPKTSAGIIAIDFMNVFVRAWHASADKSQAVASMLATVGRTLEHIETGCVMFAAEGGHEYRRAIQPDYKATRDAMPDELRLAVGQALNAIDAIGWPIISEAGFEADDVLASVARFHRSSGVVIVSGDKDLLALSGIARVFKPWKPAEFVTAREVMGVDAGQVADVLALAGDDADNVPGVPGVGIPTAAKLLGKLKTLADVFQLAQWGTSKRHRNIHHHRATVERSRRVVELVDTLHAAESLNHHIRSDWASRLAALKVSPSQRLARWLVAHAGTKVEACEYCLTVHDADGGCPCFQCGCPMHNGHAIDSGATNELRMLCPNCDDERRAASPMIAAGLPATDGEPGTDPRETTSGHGMRELVFITRAITEPIRQGITYAERWDGPDGGLIQCWESGRKAEPGKACPWKDGSPNREAWEQGQRGEDLRVELPVEHVPDSSPEPAMTEATATQTSLF